MELDSVDRMIAGIEAASTTDADEAVVLLEDLSRGSESEFLFFLKPELTGIVRAGSGSARELITLVLAKIDEFGLEPFAIRALPSRYLAKYKLLEQHYGVINRLAHNPRAALTADSRAEFGRVYGISLEQATVLGGFEFLSRFPEYSSSTLDELWMEAKSTKLGAGTYCRAVQIHNQTVYLINGFHPGQIEHYTAPGKCILVLALRGRLQWARARREFVGATDPSQAQPASIRGTLLASSSFLGIGEVSQALNGVHLSAGPVEGLCELGRYLLPPEATLGPSIQWVEHFSFGRALMRSFDSAEIASTLANITVPWQDSSKSIFELTEEKDPEDAILLLENVQFDIPQIVGLV